MKRIITITTFLITIFIANITYAAGSVSLSSSKSSVTVGEEFTVSVNLSRCINCKFNSKNKRRHLKGRLYFRT